MATESANTSRPQPFAADMGVRNKPSVERGPKLIIAIAQPQTTITAGVRQLVELTTEAAPLTTLLDMSC